MIHMGRRPAHRRRVEADAAANLSISELYEAATKRFGSATYAKERLEAMCAELEHVALSPIKNAVPASFLLSVAEEIWLDEEERPHHDDLARTMAQIAQRVRENQPLIWCDLHGWLEPYGYGQCDECPCRLPTYSPTPNLDIGGRPRRYCSNACRQRAYRRRLKNREDTGNSSSAER
ncbi:hypothetical protein K8O92_26090 [Nocardia asteroides]|nr:hypothetical protein K8O92_26090 [Nocardia asteroides]